MLRYTTRPLSDRTWVGQGKRETSRFTAGWTETLDLLQREYEELKGRDLVIEVDVPERAIRNDGMLRADAKAGLPAVVVAFESKHGPLLYQCDRYNGLPWRPKMNDLWQHNVRAIALTLQALRAVERYGASQHGEQYRGYKAIGTGSAVEMGAMSRDDAFRLVASLSGQPLAVVALGGADLRSAVRLAKRYAHPDADTGSRETWDALEQALRAIGES